MPGNGLAWARDFTRAFRRGNQEDGDAEGLGSTATISAPSLVHFEVSPVRRISGVSNPTQTQPVTVIGPPPPLPGALPDATSAA